MNEFVKLWMAMVCCSLVRGGAAARRDLEVGVSAAGGPGSLRQAVGLTCGDSSNDAEATFTNPSYPNAETSALGSCQLRVRHHNQNICQIRMDFIELILSQPDNAGVCDLDFLQVTGGSSNIPTICGDNSGQHLYVDVTSDVCTDSSLINIDTSVAGGKWSIKIKQIECNAFDRAPPGCLQYFTATSGTISSFNFNPASVNTGDTHQLANQEYGVCIKTQPGYCSVTYRQAAGSAFSLSLDPTALGPSIPLPSIVGPECTADFLLIPNGIIADTTNVFPSTSSADRYCGLSFPEVTSTSAPYNIYVVTDSHEAPGGDIANTGFKLTYQMNAC